VEALLYGVGAAVAFGFGDYAAAMATRRAGFAWTALAMQVIGNAALVLVLLVMSRWPAFAWSQVPWAFALATNHCAGTMRGRDEKLLDRMLEFVTQAAVRICELRSPAVFEERARMKANS